VGQKPNRATVTTISPQISLSKLLGSNGQGFARHISSINQAEERLGGIDAIVAKSKGLYQPHQQEYHLFTELVARYKLLIPILLEQSMKELQQDAIRRRPDKLYQGIGEDRTLALYECEFSVLGSQPKRIRYFIESYKDGSNQKTRIVWEHPEENHRGVQAIHNEHTPEQFVEFFSSDIECKATYTDKEGNEIDYYNGQIKPTSVKGLCRIYHSLLGYLNHNLKRERGIIADTTETALKRITTLPWSGAQTRQKTN